MKEIGLGILDPHTVISVVLTVVLANLLLGFPFPIVAKSVEETLISVVLFTGFIYIGRTVIRLPIAAITALVSTVLVDWGKPDWLRDWDYTVENKMLKTGIGLINVLRILIKAIERILYVFINFGRWQVLLRDHIENVGFLPDSLNNSYIGALINVLGILDRIGVIILAFISTLPVYQTQVKAYGFYGIVLMLVVFTLQGNYTAILGDYYEKMSREKRAYED